ncbi:hypothetical protein BGZ54_005358, partial [Gamsiella multidivaricata]
MTPAKDFTIVSRGRRHWMMIHASAICGGRRPHLSNLMVNINKILSKKAAIIGQGAMEYLVDDDPMAVIPTVVFEVSTSDQLETALRYGFSNVDDDGNTVRTHFQEYTTTRQKAKESQVVRLNNIAWNTKENQVYAAMARWDVVRSVEMGFNKTHSMATARVTFANSTAVTRMIEEKVTYVIIGKDSGAVTHL